VQLARFLVNAWQGATIRLKITQSCEPIDDFLNVAFKALLK
jgi:TetR/AcrR family transcriptional repressor of nem operon